jgi:hypothetical protein
MPSEHRAGFWHRIAPGLTLVVLAPMIAEILPGATRMSSIFVLPVEMGVWGVGALLIRAAVRHWRLGWKNMLLLAVALSLAEEFLIQQTSFAPLVIEIVKGPPYARDFGVNWLYLIWAVGYESVLVVFLPVMLAELIFPQRHEQAWVSKGGLVFSLLYFAIGCFFAWFSWTQYVRTKIFHLPAYAPPVLYLELAAAAVLVLILAAIGPTRRLFARPSAALPPPHPMLIGVVTLLLAVFWYALIILAFRAWPGIPPVLPAIVGASTAVMMTVLYGRWSSHERWSDAHRFAVVLGGMIGSMGIGFIGFIGALPFDLYGKAVLDIIATVLLALLWIRRRRAPGTA